MPKNKTEELKSSQSPEQKPPFKLETEVFSYGSSIPIPKTSYHNSLKLLRQASARKEHQFFVIGERKYMLNAQGEYEPFVVFGKSAVGLSQLKAAVQRIEMEESEKHDPHAPSRSASIPKTWK